MKRNWQKLSDMEQVTNYEAYHVCDPRSNGWKVGETYNTSTITRPLPKKDFKRCIEEAAEIQRKSINPHLPSRINCLFVCRKENVHYWYNYFQKRHQEVALTIFKVKLTGNLLWTYADYLQLTQYWEPKTFSVQEPEGLFEGEYIIDSICDFQDFNDLKK